MIQTSSDMVSYVQAGQKHWKASIITRTYVEAVYTPSNSDLLKDTNTTSLKQESSPKFFNDLFFYDRL